MEGVKYVFIAGILLTVLAYPVFSSPFGLIKLSSLRAQRDVQGIDTIVVFTF